MDHETRLRESHLRDMYEAFNDRDVDRLLERMSGDVDWPNAWDGGRVIGRDAVRGYCTRQWARIDSRVVPIGYGPRPDGTLAVAVRQTVRDLDGTLLLQGPVTHVYAFDGGLVARMDVEE